MREKSNNNKRSIEERVRSEQATGSGGALDADTTHITDEEAVRKEITQERDKRIQQEIRYLFTYSFSYSLTHSLTHSLTYSLTH